MPPAQEEHFRARARPGPDSKPNFRAMRMQPDPTENSACPADRPTRVPRPRKPAPGYGRWVLATALACSIGVAAAAPTPKPATKGPATATQPANKDDSLQAPAPT